MDRSHFDIVAESIAAQHPADDQTHSALEVLADRLRRVRSLGGSFAKIEFSSHVRKLEQQCRAVPVG